MIGAEDPEVNRRFFLAEPGLRVYPLTMPADPNLRRAWLRGYRQGDV